MRFVRVSQSRNKSGPHVYATPYKNKSIYNKCVSDWASFVYLLQFLMLWKRTSYEHKSQCKDEKKKYVRCLFIWPTFNLSSLKAKIMNK